MNSKDNGYTHLLLDFPSDHEVEDSLPTECDVIRSVVSNRGEDGKVKHVRATRFEALQKKCPRHPYEHVGFVHVAGHADERGLGLIGDAIGWCELADVLKDYCAPLACDQQRVLCLSCCSSAMGVKKLQSILSDWFSGYYYFSKEEVNFADSIAAWSLFYLQKDAEAPMSKLWTENNEGERQNVNTSDLINSAIPAAGFRHKKGLNQVKQVKPKRTRRKKVRKQAD